MKKITFILSFLLLSVAAFAQNTWKADPFHSKLGFTVTHLGIADVPGHFDKYDVTITSTKPDFSDAVVELTAQVNSINTRVEPRDNHLKSADFFDAEKYPQLTFTADSFQNNGDEGKVTGDLTIKGVTRPVTLNVEFGGIVVDPYGQTKAGFTVDGKVNRKDFNLTWDAVTEAGQVVVSNEIKLHCEIQLVKQA